MSALNMQSPVISCGVWQVKGDAGHLAEVEFFVGFEEVIEGCLDSPFGVRYLCA
jgi:hypothetical protein